MSFDYQATLVGKLIELRPLREEDFADLFAVASDPLIWEQHPVKTRCEEEGFREFFTESLNSGGALVVIDVATKKIIGSSRFHGFNAEKDEVEIGWTYLARAYWGGVYNGELKELMLRHAFQFVGNVVFLIGPTNFRSQKAVEKIGAVKIENRKNASGQENYCYRLSAPASS